MILALASNNKIYNDIKLNFMILRHTKFVYNRYFRNIKKLFYKTRINTVENIKQVINISAIANETVRYKKELDQVWYDFVSFLSSYFKAK